MDNKENELDRLMDEVAGKLRSKILQAKEVFSSTRNDKILPIGAWLKHPQGWKIFNIGEGKGFGWDTRGEWIGSDVGWSYSFGMLDNTNEWIEMCHEEVVELLKKEAETRYSPGVFIDQSYAYGDNGNTVKLDGDMGVNVSHGLGYNVTVGKRGVFNTNMGVWAKVVGEPVKEPKKTLNNNRPTIDNQVIKVIELGGENFVKTNSVIIPVSWFKLIDTCFVTEIGIGDGKFLHSLLINDIREYLHTENYI